MNVIEANGLGLKFKVRKRRKRYVQDAALSLVRRYGQESGSFWALRDVGFGVAKGETLGVIGRNGSGKTTLLRVIGGIYTPDEGRIDVRGRVSTLLSTTAGFQPELSGTENVFLNGILMGFSKKEVQGLYDKIVDFAELGDFMNMPVKTYSAGMYARLGFAIAINVKEDILLVDEVLGVGDAKFSEKARAAMDRVLTEGRTIILVSHQMDTIRRFATRVLWLDKGKVMAEGPTEDVITQYLSA